MPLEFITTRELVDKAGAVKGMVKLMKLVEEPDALVEYVCPMCGFSEKKKVAWAEPFVTGTGANKKFCVQCGKCGFQMKFLKLKKEAAKGKKGK
ncbi:MAG: hypothetical protein NT016_03370 [Candidatus Aenigmarchaeota archaeon]|nr:hypothetical protein [Candidatus Aenigmarchaeota archaeon]